MFNVYSSLLRRRLNEISMSKRQNNLIQFINCRLVRNHQLVKDDLWIRNGKIVNPEPIFFDEKCLADSKIDCANAIIAPGYIDLQINGI